jgi:hypothetical protein
MGTDLLETNPVPVHGGRPPLAATHPDLSAEWDYEENGDLTPWHVSAGSGVSAGWKCAAHGHCWRAKVYNRSNGKGCGTCAGQTCLAGFNDLGSKDKALSAEWDYEVNDGLTPEQVTVKSNAMVGWKCSAQGHRWRTTVSHRSKGSGCGTCMGRICLAGFNDLGSKDKALSAEWDYEANDGLTPEQVTVKSCVLVGWKCAAHGHRWRATVNRRSSGKGCGTCAGRTCLAGFNDLRSKNPTLAAEWDYDTNDGLTPEQVTVSSHVMAGWKCAAHGHRWRTKVSNRSSGHGCPKCSKSQTSKIEHAFFVELQQYLADAKNGVTLPVAWGSGKTSSVDIVGIYAGGRVAIEYDGAYFHGPVHDRPGKRSKQDNDVEKTSALLAAGYRVVRIRENQLPHLLIEHPNLFQLSFEIRGTLTDQQRVELVKPTAALIVAWLNDRSPTGV